jgi:hypothetical protein
VLSPSCKIAANWLVAVIQRGCNTFVEKVERVVEAGAVAVVITGLEGHAPCEMGGGDVGGEEYETSIPAFMVSFEVGARVREFGGVFTCHFCSKGENFIQVHLILSTVDLWTYSIISTTLNIHT